MNRIKAPVTVLPGVLKGTLSFETSIKNVLGQTYRSLKFLIIDDGSTDESRTVLGRSADRDLAV